jgi:hypothetical protein
MGALGQPQQSALGGVRAEGASTALRVTRPRAASCSGARRRKPRNNCSDAVRVDAHGASGDHQGDWLLVAPACDLTPTWAWSWNAGVPLNRCWVYFYERKITVKKLLLIGTVAIAGLLTASIEMSTPVDAGWCIEACGLRRVPTRTCTTSCSSVRGRGSSDTQCTTTCR